MKGFSANFRDRLLEALQHQACAALAVRVPGYVR